MVGCGLWPNRGIAVTGFGSTGAVSFGWWFWAVVEASGSCEDGRSWQRATGCQVWAILAKRCLSGARVPMYGKATEGDASGGWVSWCFSLFCLLWLSWWRRRCGDYD